jgi:hypothetical protein
MTTLHYSLEPQYESRLPWQVASVALDCGPVAFAHLQAGAGLGSRVTVRIVCDSNGSRMLAALHNEEEAPMWLQSSGLKEKSQ